MLRSSAPCGGGAGRRRYSSSPSLNRPKIIFPAVVYLILGLFFLKRFLDHYFRGWIPYLAVILVFAGTNLYFFSIDEGLMSHVYSFFLFSLFLFLVKKYFSFSGMKRGSLSTISDITPNRIIATTPRSAAIALSMTLAMTATMAIGVMPNQKNFIAWSIRSRGLVFRTSTLTTTASR